MNKAIIVDVGGSKTSVSLAGKENSKIEIYDSDVFYTNSHPELTVQKILNFWNEKSINVENLSLSLPGRWDNEGKLQEGFFLHDWLNYPFVKELSSALCVQNYTWETDVICGALGEDYVLTENHRHKSLLYLNLGTGVGAALIKHGKPYKSDSKLTLRMQKLVLPFQDELYSGVDLISGGSLLQATRYVSTQVLFHEYKQGKVEALDIVSRAQTQLASWLINLFYLFGPDLIVLNGGLTYDWEVLALGAVDIAKEELEDQVIIIPSKLKEKAPIYGAYLNFFQKFNKVVNQRCKP